MAANNPQTGATLDDALDNVFDLDNEKSAPADSHTIGENDDDADDEGSRVEGQQPEQNEQVDEEGNPLADLPPGFKEKPLKNEKGQIVDKNGKVLAATRADKQLLHNFNRLRHASDKLHKQNLDLVKQVRQSHEAMALPRQLGLNNQQFIEAVQLRASFEKDAPSAVRDVVARVLAQGYTMEQLFGPDAVQGINTQAITQQMDQRLRPLTDRLAAQDAEVRRSEQARESYTAFVTEHEHAETHGEAIASLMQDRGLPPEKAYYALEVFAARNGLDFSQPLAPQIQAAQNANRRRSPQGQQRRAPSTPGSARSMQNSGQQTSNETSPMDVDWNTIVKGAMSS